MLTTASTSVFAQTTYFSRDGGTSDWDLATSWTLSSDGVGDPAGPPGQNDYVIILNGHTIIVDDITDNGGLGQSADGLGLANVGAGVSPPGNTFPDSGTDNFFHNGEMTVEEGGTLIFKTRVMFDGTIFIAGTLTTDYDIIILGNLYFAPSAFFSSTDDLICSGNSNTRIDIPDEANSWTSDDIYLDHTDAFVCGLGILEIGKGGSGPNSHIINLNNGADYDQICTNLTIIGCDSGPCAGTGIFSPSTPSLSGAGGTINYVENSVEVIDNTIGIVYTEPLPYLTAATVTISNNYVNGEDVLNLPGISTIVAVFDPATGTLNLSGYGNVARWETALQSITYENLSDNPTAATRTIGFQVNDGFNNSNTISRNITIEPVNDPPDVSTISGSPTPLDYTENDGAVAIDDQIEVDDPDDVNLEGATVSLTNYVQGEDSLFFSDANGITMDGFDVVTGILTLSGSATVANYQLALKNVTYKNISDDPDLTTRTANFIVNDGDADSPPFTRDIDITAVNDAPVIDGTSTALNYSEGDGAVSLDAAISVTDADNTNLVSATITIGNFQSGEDVITFVDQNGITGSFAAGILTLTGTATLAEYETALQSITYDNTSNTPNTLTRTISFVVNDGTDDSNTFNRDINITNTNDLPVVDGSATTLLYTEGDGAVVLDNGITVSDPDHTNLVSATITISNNYASGEDELGFSDQNGISGTYASGELTLLGSAVLADYQTALQSITYENTSDNPSILTRTVIVVVNDGIDNSIAFSRDIEFTPVNDAPELLGTATALTYTEGDGAVLLDDAIVVSDVDNINLNSASISIITNFETGEDVLSFVDQNGITGSYVAGVLTLSGSAVLSDYQAAIQSVTYENTSENPVVLTRTVSIIVNDGSDNSTAFTRDIEITAIYDIPIITRSAIALTYTEGDGAVLIDNGISVTDVDNSNLASAIITISANYQSGEDELAFIDQSGITGNYLAGALTLTGSAPLADYQAALQSITYENTSENPGILIRTVDIIVNDGTNNSDAFTRDIEITAVNDAPVLVGTATALVYTEGDGAVVLDDAFAISDVDNANLASATITIAVNYQSGEDELVFTDQNGITGTYATGVLSLTGSATLADYQSALQSITYENSSANPSVLTRTVSILVNDGNDNSLEFTRDIEVTAINNAPSVTGSASTLTYTEGDGAVVVEGAANVSDVDNTNIESATLTITNNYQAGEDILAFSDQNGITGSFLTGVLSLSGSATVADYQAALQSITYENTSEAPSTLTRTLGIVVNDGIDNSSEVTRDIEITSVNDIPELTGTSTELTYTEGDGAVILDDAISVADVDHTDMASATITISTNYQTAEDVLDFTDQNGITGIFTAGVLTLTGSATLADYQAALRSVTYENTSIAPNTTNRTVEISISDGIDPSVAITREISIIPLIEPPYISVPGKGIESSLSYTEGDGAVPLLSDFLIDDPDDINLEGATLVFDANFVSGEDVLAFADQTSIAGTYDAATGTLLLSGTATLADYALAIKAITFENTSDNPNTVDRTLLLSVSDGDITSNDIIITIDITPVNDAPEVEGSGSPLVYPESSGPIAIDNELMPSDVDDVELESAVVTIVNNYQVDEDILGFTDQGSITGNFDEMTGALTLTGTASISDYQLALRSVTYENTEDRADLSARLVEVVVSDGDLNSEVFNIEILLEEVIDPVIPYQLVTPDNDGYNDSWIIDGIEQYSQSQVRLFDRWNKLVYQQESYDNISTGWTGIANQGFSGELPDGTYFYVINLGNGSELIEGFLILKRK